MTLIKTLKVDRVPYSNSAEAKGAIAPLIDGFYNLVRRHSTREVINFLQFERPEA